MTVLITGSATTERVSVSRIGWTKTAAKVTYFQLGYKLFVYQYRLQVDVAAVPQTADATMDSVFVISVTLDQIVRKVYNVVELQMSYSLCQ